MIHYPEMVGMEFGNHVCVLLMTRSKLSLKCPTLHFCLLSVFGFAAQIECHVQKNGIFFKI